MTARFASVLLAWMLSTLGCGGREVPDPGDDAGGSHDGGPAIDSSTGGDAGQLDAGQLDGGPGDAGEQDAGAVVDASGSDAGSDASTQTDACVPPPCAPPPAGCGYVGGSECECGTLVCEPALDCGGACGDGEYCNLCATPDPVCATRPADMGRICIGVYMPVCGCDGMTYGNGCQLASAGIGLLFEGECSSGP